MKLVLLVVCSLVAAVLARPEGAPNGACDAVLASPNPHGPPQNPAVNATPYQLTITPFPDNGQYVAAGTYTVTFSACGANNNTFRGILMVAVNNMGERQGTWTPAEGLTQTTCSDNRGLTHTNGQDKSSVTATWTAPAEGSGDIQFRYAAVQTRNVHWSNVYEATLSDPAETTTDSAGSGAAAISYGSKLMLFIGSILVLSLAL